MGRRVGLESVCLVLLVRVLLFHHNADGKPTQSGCDQQVDCRRRMQAGLALLSKGSHQAALVELDAAYQTSHDPSLLATLGQAHQQLGHSQEALDFYQRYLKEAPADALERNQILKALTALIMAAPAPESEPAQAAPDEGKEMQLKRPDSEMGSTCSGTAKRMHPQRRVGWALIGIGGAVLVPSIALAAINGNPAPGDDCTYGYASQTACRYATTNVFAVGFAMAGASLAVGTSLLLLPPVGYGTEKGEKMPCGDRR